MPLSFGESTALDETDRKLIALLADNARTPAAALARALGLSRTTVQSRIERLERRGVVRGYHARLAEGRGEGVRAHVMITVRPKEARAVEAALRFIPEVRRLESVSGPFDLIAHLKAPTTDEMDALIDRIGAAPGVERTTSAIVLSTKIER